MRLANPAAVWLLALAAPVVLLHVLRPRRPREQVGSTYLWRELASPVAAASPWQRLVPSLLLVLQLLAVALLTLAAARPVRTQETALAEHTVFIVDASASMAARDGDPDRMATARRRVRELRDELPDDGLASVVVAGTRAAVALTASARPGAVEEALAGVEASEGRADFGGAFALAQSLETPGTPIGFVLVSDGGLSEAERRLVPPGTRYEPVGAATTNRALTALVVEPRGSGLHAIVTVANTGGPRSTQTLRIDVDGRTRHEVAVTLDAGGVRDVEADLPLGERVEAFLEGEDLLDLDDHLYAAAPRTRDLEVVLAGPDDPFLDLLLDSLPGVTVTRSAPAVPADDADLVIYDRVPVPADPGAPFLAIAPPGGIPGPGGVAVDGTVERPAIALVDAGDPLLADVDLSDVAVASAQRIEAPLAKTLVGAEGAPLLVRGEHAGRDYLYLAFSPTDSNLPVDVAFPILGDRIVRELAGGGLGATALTVGDRLPVERTRGATVTRPGGATVQLAPGETPSPVDRTGFWEVAPGDAASLLVAVNPPPEESRLAPVASLPVPERLRPRGTDAATGTTDTPALAWAAVPLLGLLLAEWAVARRRVGVGRRQWRAAVVARVVIAGLVAAALAGAAWDRPARRVAVAFVVDASDSLGPGGREQAVAWVRDALRSQPDDALAGIILFGGDARLETTMRRHLSLDRPAVQVDASATDLAAAVRLAAAVLPDDARRRIVLVSDGRATQGDAAEEAALLAESGIGLDVHVVGRATGTDAAVAGLDLPGRVRAGEAVTLTATVEATTAAPALVSLTRDGVLVEERTVALDAGTNTVTFVDTATGSGVSRYQVRVRRAGDSIPENDVAFGAAQVEGPPTVLLVEGRDGVATTLRAALEAAGIRTQVVAAASIPPVDVLAGVASTVLVDVDARALAPEHVTALTAATRDLGRGLVTIGGTQSYGLGGYLGSELEDLLPVISEILDPERRQTVAEVLAIDTSGSMGACHCAEGSDMGGNSFEGGVNKTDISRAGAARAIAALSDLDEVGVLAIDTQERWVIDLQQLPAEEVVTSGLRKLVPSGDGTDLSRSLQESAEALRRSDAALKHVILFTDGFVEPGQLAGLERDAAALAEEGITVSVVATGEGASEELQRVADAGQGRFYPGRDLQQVPTILEQEAVLASRDFVQEGRFLPEVTSSAAPVAGLRAAPPLLGYVASTAKPAASTLLRIGPEHDPLLSTWRVGLGKATSWTSDLDRWGQLWTRWDGFVGFWAGVVEDTFPTGADAGGVRARVEGDDLHVVVEGSATFPEGATATARVAGPDGETREVPLTRASGNTFTGATGVTGAGTYAVGAAVEAGGRTVVAGSALATRSYRDEYVPGRPDEALLERLSRATSGRGAIDPEAAFAAADLEPGRARTRLDGWLLLAAALLWPLAVALSRLSLRGAPVLARAGHGLRVLRWRAARLRPGLPGRPAGSSRERPARPTPPPQPTPPAPVPPATLGTLLDAKRRRAGGPPPRSGGSGEPPDRAEPDG